MNGSEVHEVGGTIVDETPTGFPGGNDRRTEDKADGAPPSVQDGAERSEEVVTSKEDSPAYLFRGDENYAGGPVGSARGSAEAQVADIQNPADHVLRKRPGQGSIYTSFTEKVDAAERFAGERKFIMKVAVAILRELESEGEDPLMVPRRCSAMVAPGRQEIGEACLRDA
jgi:hypothetical protein